MAASELDSSSPFWPSSLLASPDGDDLLPSVEEILSSPRKGSAIDHRNLGDGSETEHIVIQDNDRETMGDGDGEGEGHSDNGDGKEVPWQGSGSSHVQGYVRPKFKYPPRWFARSDSIPRSEASRSELSLGDSQENPIVLYVDDTDEDKESDCDNEDENDNTSSQSISDTHSPAQNNDGESLIERGSSSESRHGVQEQGGDIQQKAKVQQEPQEADGACGTLQEAQEMQQRVHEVDQRMQERQEEVGGLLQVAHETGQEMLEVQKAEQLQEVPENQEIQGKETQREELLLDEGQGQKDTSEEESSTKANGMQLRPRPKKRKLSLEHQPDPKRRMAKGVRKQSKSCPKQPSSTNSQRRHVPTPAERLSAAEEAATTNIERQEYSLPAVLKVNHSLLVDKSSYTLEVVLDSLSQYFLLAYKR